MSGIDSIGGSAACGGGYDGCYREPYPRWFPAGRERDGRDATGGALPDHSTFAQVLAELVKNGRFADEVGDAQRNGRAGMVRTREESVDAVDRPA